MIASNNNGVWNEQGASLTFSILPAYWQTLWFRAVCGAAVLGVLVLLYWLRVRQLAHAFNMKLDARVDERTRIARDLHDTLLQNFQGVLLQLRAALRFLEREPAKAQEVLTSAIDQAAQSIRGGREAVQGLRASAQESNDLPGAIVRLGKELAAAHSGVDAPSVQVAVEGTVRDLHPIVRDEVFRVGAEALRNVFQHSHATQVEVELCYDVREFRLRVRDDGRASIRRSSPAAAGKDILGCAACANGQSSLAVNSRYGVRRIRARRSSSSSRDQRRMQRAARPRSSA